ncbi:MAG: hypothetical protein Kow0081_3350 [Candidatus Dojkabacteria bacterium]
MKKWKVLDITDVSPYEWIPLSKHTVEIAPGKITDDFFVSHNGDVSISVVVLPNKKIPGVKQYKWSRLHNRTTCRKN